METLLLVPLDDTIVFPGMTATLALEVGDEERVLLVPRTEGEFASVGTVAEVVERMRIPGGTTAVTVQGLHRGVPGAARTDSDGALRVEVTPHEDPSPRDERTRVLAARVPRGDRGDPRPARGRRRASARSCARSASRAPLADTSGYSPDLSLESKIELLETLDVTERLEKALAMQRERLAELQVRVRIRDDVQAGAEQQQREYFLRKQMESIRKELGEDEESVVEEYRDQDRRGRHAGGRPGAGREGARAASSGWARPRARPR